MRREPLLAPFLALAAGVVAGHFVYFRFQDLLWPFIFAVIVLIICRAAPRAKRLAEPSLLLVASLIGAGTQVVHRQGLPPKLTVPDGEIALLDGCVIDPPVFGGGKAQFRCNSLPGGPYVSPA